MLPVAARKAVDAAFQSGEIKYLIESIVKRSFEASAKVQPTGAIPNPGLIVFRNDNRSGFILPD